MPPDSSEPMVQRFVAKAEHDLRAATVLARESLCIVVRREAFVRIGGYLEDFKDWGAEDNEFYDRAATLKVLPGRALPTFCPRPRESEGI
jgi:predicted glycosyltransferase involved in capsule biosynthesis